MRKVVFSFLLVLLCLSLSVISSASAQTTYQGIEVITNPHASFRAHVFTDRDPSGRSVPSYRVGEFIRLGVTVSAAAYVYLFSVDSAGKVIQVLPNRADGHGGNHHVQAGGTVYFPPAGAGYSYRVTGPYGLDKVFVIASQTPLTSSTLTGFNYEGAFATSYAGEQVFGTRVIESVRPLPQGGWVTASARFQVVP